MNEKMKYKKISIVTPSLNQMKYIEDCIKSVLNQNYPNFEHIIIDGGSTDGTIEIIKKYPHLKWISEPDEGQSDALNKGFKMAEGDIIGWLNADDYYLKDTFITVSEYFIKNKSIDAIYGDYFFINTNGQIQKAMPEMSVNKVILTYYRCYIPSTAFFFKKELIEEGFLIDKSFNYSMDHEFFLRLINNKKKIAHVKKYMACFRWHGDNKTEQTGRNSPDWSKIYDIYGVKITNNKKINHMIHLFLKGYSMFLRGGYKLFIFLKYKKMVGKDGVKIFDKS